MTTTIYRIDDRWAPGASRAAVPESAVAIYSARWIDMGEFPADVVPDRQGYAYDERAELDELHLNLSLADARRGVVGMVRDEPTPIVSEGRFHLWARRAGGYFYVDAWLDPQGIGN
jgi:hypothetical protein